MKILCQWQGNWYLTSGVDSSRGVCVLECANLMPHPEHWIGGVHAFGEVHDIASITLYPVLRYHGLRVAPEGWELGTPTPALSVSPPSYGWDDLSDPYWHEIRQRIGAQNPVDVLIEEGWNRPGMVEFRKWLRLDQIEKIGGAPPSLSSQST